MMMALSRELDVNAVQHWYQILIKLKFIVYKLFLALFALPYGQSCI
jgi:hypothetical protein